VPGARTHAGSLPSGSRYVVEAPQDWNGVLLVFSHPVPVRPGDPPWEADEPLIRDLVSAGYAVAGSANTIFWPLELVFADEPALLDTARRLLGAPRHVIPVGVSIGGIISAGRVQRCPSRFSGALPMCGNLAGAVAIHNRGLDIGFVVKTLLARGSALQLVHITDPKRNLDLSMALLHEAQASSAGRARLALAAAIGTSGWKYPTSAEPAPGDFDARLRNQLAWLPRRELPRVLLGPGAGGTTGGRHPSWNTDVDYRELLSRSINLDEVEALYDAARLDLEEDLQRLADEPRIAADTAAVAYLERNLVFNGQLRGVPVLTVHTDGDGLVTPDNARAYAEVVHHAGNRSLLRQLYVHRGGHCTFTSAEVLAALAVLVERIETGTWPALDPQILNDAARRLGAGCNRLASGEPTDAAFFDSEPPPFPRPYDVRHVPAR
jgi:hypothetical protein